MDLKIKAFRLHFLTQTMFSSCAHVNVYGFTDMTKHVVGMTSVSPTAHNPGAIAKDFRCWSSSNEDEDHAVVVQLLRDPICDRLVTGHCPADESDVRIVLHATVHRSGVVAYAGSAHSLASWTLGRHCLRHNCQGNWA